MPRRASWRTRRANASVTGAPRPRAALALATESFFPGPVPPAESDLLQELDDLRPAFGRGLEESVDHRFFHRGAPRRLFLRALHVHRHSLRGEVFERGRRRLLREGDGVLLDLDRGRLDGLAMRGRELVPPRRVGEHVEIDREDRTDGAELLHFV